MKTTNNYVWMAAFLLVGTFFLAGCSNARLQTTRISVTDPDRHYYPIMAGQKLALDYEIKNTGEAELVISEIQATCGCIAVNEGRKVLPSGQSLILKFEYDSSKNVGYVAHEILLYGNFDSTSVYRLSFDVNVVPHADYTKDYEQLYEENQQGAASASEGLSYIRNRKNYYVDQATKDR